MEFYLRIETLSPGKEYEATRITCLREKNADPLHHCNWFTLSNELAGDTQWKVRSAFPTLGLDLDTFMNLGEVMRFTSALVKAGQIPGLYTLVLENGEIVSISREDVAS